MLFEVVRFSLTVRNPSRKPVLANRLVIEHCGASLEGAPDEGCGELLATAQYPLWPIIPLLPLALELRAPVVRARSAILSQYPAQLPLPWRAEQTADVALFQALPTGWWTRPGRPHGAGLTQCIDSQVRVATPPLILLPCPHSALAEQNINCSSPPCPWPCACV